MIMDRHTRESLDRYITGNYGEDQFRNREEFDEFGKCKVEDCESPAHDEDGLCYDHMEGYAFQCAGCGDWYDTEERKKDHTDDDLCPGCYEIYDQCREPLSRRNRKKTALDALTVFIIFLIFFLLFWLVGGE